MAEAELPFVESIHRQDRQLDPITQQLLFGLGGEGGFIPGAFRAAERVFFDDQGRPLVIPQEIAGLTPDQIRAAQLARQAVGVQQPFIQEAAQQARAGIGALESGLTDQALAQARALQEIQSGARFALDQRDRGLLDALTGVEQARGRALTAEERLRGDLADLAGFQTGAVGRFAQQLGEQERLGRRAADQFGMDLARARQQGRRTFDEFGRDISDVVGMSMIEREDLARGLSRGEELAAAAGASQRGRLGLAELGLKGGIGQLERGLTRQLAQEADVTGRFGQQLQGQGGAEEFLRRTISDPTIQADTQRFMDPFEEQVVQQSIQDALKGLAQSDMAQTARDIQTGGESAFGSRARLTAAERAEALGRGLAKEVGGLRSAGFQRAQQTAISEDERRRQAERAASSGLASLAQQRLGADRGLIDRAAQAGQTRFGAVQALAGQRAQRAGAELGATRQLSDILRQGAQSRFGAGQAVTGLAQQAAQAKLGAGSAFGNLIQQTAQQQLASQQALGQQMGQTAQAGLGAQQQLAGQLGQQAQQRFQAGTGLGQQLGALGQQAAGARAQAGQQALGIAGQQAAQLGQIGQQQAAAGQTLQQARQGFGGFLTGLGQQAQQATAADVAQLGGIGAQQQQQRQRELDAQRAGLLQAQQAPLAQYQALMPFVQMAPSGFSQTQTSFTPTPSALQAGLGTGLSTLGALGNFYGQPASPS